MKGPLSVKGSFSGLAFAVAVGLRVVEPNGSQSYFFSFSKTN